MPTAAQLLVLLDSLCLLKLRAAVSGATCELKPGGVCTREKATDVSNHNYNIR